MKPQADLFFDATELQRRRQFRMRRLQLYQWGTFAGLHDISISQDGFLLVGRSGSGKSTVLDAIAALLVPPQWLLFNAAARDGERGRRDRNFASYVRGAWGDQKDTDSGEIATRFLRPGTTWSALAITFANEEGRQVSLVQIYWLKGKSNANADVRKHYMIAERGFDLGQELDDFDLDVRRLKHALQDVDHFGGTFRPYGERFRRLLGIETEMALKLLHKTQSAKNLGDLNTFLCEFMLDEPESFVAAERLVAEFAELDAAHQEVVTARRQVGVLRPARQAHEETLDLDVRIREQGELLQGIDGHGQALRSDLLRERIEELATRDQGLLGEEGRQKEHFRNLQDELHTLEAEHRQQGGDRIEELERNKEDAEQQRDDRQARRDKVSATCKTLGWSVPDQAQAFSEVVAQARRIMEDWRRAQEDADQRRDDLRDRKKVAEEEFRELRREIEAMERQPSNIPAPMLELRRQIATDLGMHETDLPFVGELIQVREDSADWRGAIERVLHGFALSLLVDDHRYPAVSQYVNDHYLGKRLVYYRVGDEIPPPRSRPSHSSLWHRLELKDSTMQAWLTSELQQRYDYACVENMRDFRRETRALTREGQVRHGPDRHEKDDRSRVDDRRRWVLGFDNREKLALFQAQARRSAADIVQLEQQLVAQREERELQQTRFQCCVTLVNLEWQEIDVASTLDRIQKITEQLRDLREGNQTLKILGTRIEKQRQQVAQAERTLQDLEVERRTLGNELQQCQQDRDAVLEKLENAVLPQPRLRTVLAERFLADGPLNLKNLDERRIRVERSIRGELDTLREKRTACVRTMERAFAEFKRLWPQEGADLDSTLESASGFLRVLQRLEHDGLPRHEQRFFNLLKEQSTENLAALNAHLSQARKEIYTRMELVNDGLQEAEFNAGTYLQIDVADRYLPDVREFRDQVQQILGHAWQMDRDSAEERFLVLRALVQKLNDPEPESRRWRQQVLDVRLHVEFVGREVDGENKEVELYRSGAGKSGGQREKLATTCLAAALRYQLSGTDGGLPAYAAVVLDEAFGKADNEFTELAMRIFERFGFQMIVATPLKSVMTLEPFIGGACFIDIKDRKRSATLHIEYDSHQQRLQLPVHADGEDVPA